jgi:hypothetical protein
MIPETSRRKTVKAPDGRNIVAYVTLQLSAALELTGAHAAQLVIAELLDGTAA